MSRTMNVIHTLNNGYKVVFLTNKTGTYRFYLDELTRVELQSTRLRVKTLDGYILYIENTTIDDFIKELQNNDVFFVVNKNKTKIIID